MHSIKLYCRAPETDALLALLRLIQANWQIACEVIDLSTNGNYDPAKERRAYKEDFKPHAKALKRATGKTVTGLRSHSGNYFVSTPETLAVLKDGVPAWWCHEQAAIEKALGAILGSRTLPA